MATETLKNGILILIVTSKELYFYADFKYKFDQVHSYPSKVTSLRKLLKSEKITEK